MSNNNPRKERVETGFFDFLELFRMSMCGLSIYRLIS